MLGLRRWIRGALSPGSPAAHSFSHHRHIEYPNNYIAYYNDTINDPKASISRKVLRILHIHRAGSGDAQAPSRTPLIYYKTSLNRVVGRLGFIPKYIGQFYSWLPLLILVSLPGHAAHLQPRWRNGFVAVQIVDPRPVHSGLCAPYLRPSHSLLRPLSNPNNPSMAPDPGPRLAGGVPPRQLRICRSLLPIKHAPETADSLERVPPSHEYVVFEMPRLADEQVIGLVFTAHSSPTPQSLELDMFFADLVLRGLRVDINTHAGHLSRRRRRRGRRRDCASFRYKSAVRRETRQIV